MIICFDLDGTLVDTEEWILNALQQAFKQKNKNVPSKKDIFKYWGLSSKKLIKKLDPKLTQKEVLEIRDEFYKIRNKTINKIKPFPNTKRILRQLSKRYALCIVSNNPHKEVLKILRITKIDKKLFKVIIGDNEVAHPKPFPDEIYKAEKRLNKKVKFMVGDTIQDIKTANAANVKSIIILTGPKQLRKDLKKADFIIKDIKELPSLLKEVNK